MKKYLFQLLILLVFAAAIFTTLKQGEKLQSGRSPAGATTIVPAGLAPSPSLWNDLCRNLQDPLPRLFMQLILIIGVARLFGVLAGRIGQPAVVGEMIAGIVLGPSLFGVLSPDSFHFIFPESSFGSLRLFSQIGVCLFMFVVGMELDLEQLKERAHTALLVSQASILFPFLLGIISALFLFSGYAGTGTSFLAFALFIGVSMSITAFPVLARILEERRMTKTALGTTSLVCAAMNDVTAWCILALVVAVAKAKSPGSAGLTMGLVVVFAAVMLLVIKPAVSRVLDRKPGAGTLAAVAIFIFVSSLATEVLGIHALFGAFLAGLVMPARREFREFLRQRLEHFSSAFLLPLFFAFIGLRTQVGLLGDANGWLICGGIILLATLGKLGGAMFTARLTGMTWVDSFALGALMNTRGLVELIALNIGYDLGILSPRIFAMLVLMALVTTGMAGPFLTLSDQWRARKQLASVTA